MVEVRCESSSYVLIRPRPTEQLATPSRSAIFVLLIDLDEETTRGNGCELKTIFGAMLLGRATALEMLFMTLSSPLGLSLSEAKNCARCVACLCTTLINLLLFIVSVSICDSTLSAIHDRKNAVGLQTI